MHLYTYMWNFPATFFWVSEAVPSPALPKKRVGFRTAHQIHHGLLWTSGMGGGNDFPVEEVYLQYREINLLQSRWG